MSVLDKIRGLNQLNAKRCVLKRALPGFTACWYAGRSRQHHPEALGLTAGPAQTSEIKITAYPDFPYAVRVWTLIPLQFQSSLLTKYSYPPGKSCISSTYLRALASQEDFRCAVFFLGMQNGNAVLASSCSAIQNAHIPPHSQALQLHTRTRISLLPPQTPAQYSMLKTLFADSSGMTDTEVFEVIL